jgi:hypothetical protein
MKRFINWITFQYVLVTKIRPQERKLKMLQLEGIAHRSQRLVDEMKEADRCGDESQQLLIIFKAKDLAEELESLVDYSKSK